MSDESLRGKWGQVKALILSRTRWRWIAKCDMQATPVVIAFDEFLDPIREMFLITVVIA